MSNTPCESMPDPDLDPELTTKPDDDFLPILPERPSALESRE